MVLPGKTDITGSLTGTLTGIDWDVAVKPTAWDANNRDPNYSLAQRWVPPYVHKDYLKKR